MQRNGVALQVVRKISSGDTLCLELVSQRKIALEVAEKVEAASTFRNATREVAACDTSTATSQHNQNAADILKYSAGAKYNLIAGRKTSCVRLTSELQPAIFFSAKIALQVARTNCLV